MYVLTYMHVRVYVYIRGVGKFTDVNVAFDITDVHHGKFARKDFIHHLIFKRADCSYRMLYEAKFILFFQYSYSYFAPIRYYV